MPYDKLKPHLCNSHMSGTDFIFQKCLVSKSTVLAPNLPIFNTSLASSYVEKCYLQKDRVIYIKHISSLKSEHTQNSIGVALFTSVMYKPTS